MGEGVLMYSLTLVFSVEHRDPRVMTALAMWYWIFLPYRISTG